jgi:hypothetical protein
MDLASPSKRAEIVAGFDQRLNGMEAMALAGVGTGESSWRCMERGWAGPWPCVFLLELEMHEEVELDSLKRRAVAHTRRYIFGGWPSTGV